MGVIHETPIEITAQGSCASPPLDEPAGDAAEPQSPGNSAVALTPREELARLERVVQRCLRYDGRLAEALAEIHRRELFRLTHSSFSRYAAERWGLSRSRCYQLLRFWAVRERARAVGEPLPANERQARQRAADGTQDDSYARRLSRVQRCLQAHVAKILPGQRARFIGDVRALLAEIERSLDPPQSPSDPDPALQQEQATVAEAGLGAPREDPRPGPGQATQSPKAPTNCGPPGVASERSSDQAVAPQSPSGRSNTGPVYGYSMTQAWELGLAQPPSWWRKPHGV